MTQGSTTVDGVIGDDATPDANGEYDGIVTFDVNAGENVVLKSISNGWLTAVSYIPEGTVEPAPEATATAAP